jgi:hypothetical protein
MIMDLTIYFKNNTGPKEGLTYSFSDEEYTRLRDNFEAYLKKGQPKGGTYMCRPHNKDIHSQQIKVMIEFDSIALIDVRVKMEKLEEALRQSSVITNKTNDH